MPPMLNIPLLKLTGCTEEELLAHEARFCVNERHNVLQLVAETEGAPRLVVSGAGPKTARERLIQKPAVGQEVDGLVGCFHLDCAESMVPVLPDRFESSSRGSRSAETTHHVAGIIGVPPYTQQEDDLTLLSVGQIEGDLDRGTGVQSGPHLAGKPRTGHRLWAPERAVTAKEFSTVAA